MVRRDKQRGIVDIEHTNGMMQTTDRWLVVKKLLDKASEVSCMWMSCTPHTTSGIIYVTLEFCFMWPDHCIKFNTCNNY